MSMRVLVSIVLLIVLIAIFVGFDHGVEGTEIVVHQTALAAVG